jgi:hypothetical protein
MRQCNILILHNKYNMDICALPGCDKSTKNWRTHFCCISHAGKYSALSKHNGLPKLTSKVVGIKIRVPKDPSVKTQPKKYKDKTPEQQGKFVSYLVERRKKRDRSMPLWADKKAIQSIYIKAKQLTKETGIKYEVDHIIPSNHPLVCGLHIESNLQILTEYENIIKSNNFKIE